MRLLTRLRALHGLARHPSSGTGPATVAVRPARDQPSQTRRRPGALPIALARVLGAACGACDGIGCEQCADTGLR